MNLFSGVSCKTERYLFSDEGKLGELYYVWLCKLVCMHTHVCMFVCMCVCLCVSTHMCHSTCKGEKTTVHSVLLFLVFVGSEL